MGLGQIGVSRMVFRDELVNNTVERFAGPMRSIIIFDKSSLVKDGKDGVIFPTEAWREFLFRLTGYTDIDPEINQYRFYEGKLQFDFSRCLEEIDQMKSIIPEWSCARCITVCTASGVRRESPPVNYNQKMKSLTTAG